MNLKPVLVILILIAAGFGGYVFLNQPKEMPDISFKDPGGSVSLSSLRGAKEYTVVAMLMQGCPISKYTVDLLNRLQGQYGERFAFMGLLMRGQADAYKSEHGIAYPVYNFRGTTGVADPYAGNEFFESVADECGSSGRVWGGTVVVLDAQNRMLFGLAQEDVKQLESKLAEL